MCPTCEEPNIPPLPITLPPSSLSFLFQSKMFCCIPSRFRLISFSLCLPSYPLCSTSRISVLFSPPYFLPLSKPSVVSPLHGIPPSLSSDIQSALGGIKSDRERERERGGNSIAGSVRGGGLIVIDEDKVASSSLRLSVWLDGCMSSCQVGWLAVLACKEHGALHGSIPYHSSTEVFLLWKTCYIFNALNRNLNAVTQRCVYFPSQFAACELFSR